MRIAKVYGEGPACPRIGKYLTDKAEQLWFCGVSTENNWPLWWDGVKPVEMSGWFLAQWQKDREKGK